MTDANRRWIFYESLSKTQSNPVSTQDAQLAILKMSEKDTERYFIWTAGWENWQPLKAYLSSNQKIFFSSLKAAIKAKVPEKTITAYKTIKRSEREVLEMRPAAAVVEEEITKSSFNVSIGSSSGTHTSGTKTNVYSKINLEDNSYDSNEENNTSYDEKFDGDDLQLEQTVKPKINFSSLKDKSLRHRSDRHELKIEVLLISSAGKTFRSRSQNISLSGSLLEDNIPFDYTEKMFDVVVIDSQQIDPRLQRVSLKAKTIGKGVTRRIQFIGATLTTKKSLQDLLERYLQAQKVQQAQKSKAS